MTQITPTADLILHRALFTTRSTARPKKAFRRRPTNLSKDPDGIDDEATDCI